jgi:cell division protein FtsL
MHPPDRDNSRQRKRESREHAEQRIVQNADTHNLIGCILQTATAIESLYSSMPLDEEIPRVTESTELLHSLSSTASGSQPIMDYETLLTLALESTSREQTRRDENKRKKYTKIITFLVVIISGILVSMALTTTQENSEISSLERDIHTLHSQVESMKDSADADVLHRDIEEKERIINYIENDPDLDDDTKHQMVLTMTSELKELTKVFDAIEAAQNATDSTKLYN